MNYKAGMILIVLFLAISSGSVYADEGRSYYDLGVFAYEERSYDEAEKNLLFALNFEPENPFYHFYLGKTYLRIKNYDKAKQHLLKAYGLNPDIFGLIFELAMFYYETGDSGQAEALLKKAAEKDPAAADQYYAMIAEARKTKPYSLYLRLGLLYDDNAGLNPEERDIRSDKQDWGAEAYVSGNYEFVRKEQYAVGVGLSYYQIRYDSLGEYDQTASVIRAYTNYRYNPLIFGFSYMPSYYWLDSESSLCRHRFRPEVFWKINRIFSTRLTYTLAKEKDFMDKERDGNSHDIVLDGFYTLADKKGIFYATAGYRLYDASRSDQSYHQWSAKLGAAFSLWWKTELNMSGTYQNSRYDAPDMYYEIREKNDKFIGNISLSGKLFYDWLSVIADYEYVKRDSDIISRQYARNRFVLSLAANF